VLRARPFRLQPATAGPSGRRSSSGCCVPPTAARWRSRCSKAIRAIRRRWPCRSTS
jgi:hypothetical protein